MRHASDPKWGILFSLLYLAFIGALLVGAAYMLIAVAGNPSGTPLIVWFFVAGVGLLVLGTVLRWLMSKRLLPSSIIGRLERAGRGKQGTWISKVGMPIAMTCLGFVFLFGMLSGPDSGPAIFFFFAWIGITLAVLVMEMVWAFLSDRGDEDGDRPSGVG